MPRADALRFAAIAGLAALAAWLWFGRADEAATARTQAEVSRNFPEVEEAERRLAERVQKYAELRAADDWPALYEMTSPRHRESVTLVPFLGHYAHGALRVIGISSKRLAIDAERESATTDLELVAELVLDRVPARYRQGLRLPEGEEALRQPPAPFTLEWVWWDGDWYFLMDPALATGRDPSGKRIVPLDGDNP